MVGTTEGFEKGQNKRRETLLRKHGGEEGLKKYYQEMQKKSRINYKGTGGLRALSPERRREIARMGGLTRRGKKKDEADD